MSQVESLKFDIRVRDRLISRGVLQRDELVSHLAGLADLEEQLEELDLEQPALVEPPAEPEPPPTPAIEVAPAGVVAPKKVEPFTASPDLLLGRLSPFTPLKDGPVRPPPITNADIPPFNPLKPIEGRGSSDLPPPPPPPIPPLLDPIPVFNPLKGPGSSF